MNILFIFLLILVNVFGVLALLSYNRLKKFKNEIAQRDEVQKDQFYEIVHEFRAPLTAVKDAAVLLYSMPGSLPPDKQKQMLTLIKNECVRLLEQVSDVLDASKLMSKKVELQKTPNNLKNLIEEKVLMFTPQAKAATIEMEGHVDQTIGEVIYDSKYMSQVMNNLISNSLKYTPAGGKITVSAKLEGSNIVVAVFDNGTGVATEKQKELFSKFANITDQHKQAQSSGLGLYVVKGIVEAHGGTVKVDTQQNRGYKVSFTLPLTYSATGGAPAQPAASDQPASPAQTPSTPPPATPAQHTTPATPATHPAA